MNDEVSIAERLARIEQDEKSVHRRLDNLEGLVESIRNIAVETKAMREDVNSLNGRVEEVESKPIKRYETAIATIITAIISFIVGNFLDIL